MYTPFKSLLLVRIVNRIPIVSFMVAKFTILFFSERLRKQRHFCSPTKSNEKNGYH
jgi:hypothetical protein